MFGWTTNLDHLYDALYLARRQSFDYKPRHIGQDNKQVNCSLKVSCTLFPFAMMRAKIWQNNPLITIRGFYFT